MITMGGILSSGVRMGTFKRYEVKHSASLRQLWISACLFLIACLTPQVIRAVSPVPEDPFVGGVILKLKSPVPVKEPRLSYNRVVSSWYGPGFNGRRTASGIIYHQNEMTVASRTLRFNTLLYISNPATHKWVIARVTDRGPYV